MVGGGGGTGCVEYAESTFAQSVEGLRAGNFVDKVPVDKQRVGVIVSGGNVDLQRFGQLVGSPA